MWKVSQGSPKQKIDEEMGCHGRNISPQAHGVIRNKRRGKVIAGMMKWHGKISGQKAHGHREKKAWAQQEDKGLCPSDT